ncbi:MAG: bacterial Ig-like domain-containing protein [Erysipelotrichales bacterium]|nr:bacterial Ig-like domain-containing protein [Erysipelotrichales bacterium]
MKRKSILFMSIALLASTLVGCGTKSSESTTSSNSGDSTPSASVGSTSTSTETSAPTSDTPSTSIPNEEKVVTSIEVENYPDKTEYEIGEELDLTGLTIMVYYADGSSEEIPVTMSMIKSMPNMSTSGEKTVVITYEGKEDSYKITVKGEKIDPTIVFSIENGAVFTYDGTGEAPDISVIVNEDVNYDVWFEEDEVNIGTSIPTVPGTYAIVVQTEENDLYNAISAFRWFVIKAPTNKVAPTFTFTYDDNGEEVSLENGAHFVEGKVPTLTAKVNEEGVQIDEIFYAMDDGETYLGSTAPTAPGIYSINIKTIENEDFESKSAFRWYVIDPAPQDGQISVHLVGDEVVFAYDGQPHSPIWHFEDEEGNVIEDVQYTVWYSSDDTGYNSANAPIEAAWYGMTITITDDVHIMSGNNWVTFRIEAVDAKPAPDISFSINNGDIFYYDGTGEAPVIMAFVFPSDIVFTTRFEKDEVEIENKVPTEPGTYAFVCETEETDEYRAHKAWVIFTIATPESD